MLELLDFNGLNYFNVAFEGFKARIPPVYSERSER